VIAGDRPTDAALWSSVAATLRDVVLPELRDEFARAATIQLIGLTAYARGRGDDPGPARVVELRGALEELAANVHVVRWPRSDVLAACSDALVAASGHDDEDATAVRDRLRPILLRHLDEDLAVGEGLLAAFRGRVADG